MSANDIADFYVHTASVEMFLGTTGYGVDQFASAVIVACFIDGSRKLVRSPTGDQVVAESTLYTYPINAPLFVTDSRVTTSDGVSRVIKANSNTSGALDLPDHVAISLT